MITDKFGQQIYNEMDLCNLYLTNPNINLKNILVEKSITFSNDLEIENVPNIINYTIDNIDIKDFDNNCQNNWFIPNDYKNLDIAQYVLSLCKNDAELQRAGEELILYQEKDMFILLKYLKYLVDTCQNNNIVLGVGRGSSVASFVLYLMGVHKINSLYYDLSIDEFLK